MPTPTISQFSGFSTSYGYPETTSFLVTIPTCSNGGLVNVAVAGSGSLDSTYHDSSTVIRVLINSPGSIILTATSQGATSVTTTVAVRGSQSISSWGSDLPSSVTYDPTKVQKYTFVAPTSTAVALKVVVSVQSGPATVSGNVVTVTGAGTIVLVANQAGNTNVAAATAVPATNSIVVAKANQNISFNFNSPLDVNGVYNPSFTYGTDKSVAIVASASSKLASTLALSGVTPAGCVTLNASGTLTIVGAGTATITATQAGNVNFNSATRVARITVNKATQTITVANPVSSVNSFVPSATDAAPLACGGTSTSKLPVTITAGSGPVTVTNGTFYITTSPAPANGSTFSLVYSQAGNANYLPAIDVVKTYTLSRSPQTFTTKPSAPTTLFRVGNTITLTSATSSKLSTTYSVKGSDNNTGAVTISGNSITATQAGIIKVYANQAGNLTYNPAPETSVSLTIRRALQTNTINFTNPTTTLTGGRFMKGNKYTIILPTSTNATPTATSPIKIAVSGPATLSGNILTITGSGAITLTASQAQDDPKDFAAATATITIAAHETQSITLPKLSSSVSPGQTLNLKPVSSAGLTPTLSVISGHATISGTSVTFTGTTFPETITIQVSQSGTSYIDAASPQTISFNLVKSNTTITFDTSLFASLSKTINYARKSNPITLSSLIVVKDSSGTRIPWSGSVTIDTDPFFSPTYPYNYNSTTTSLSFSPYYSYGQADPSGTSAPGGRPFTLTVNQFESASTLASTGVISFYAIDNYSIDGGILNINLGSSTGRQSVDLIAQVNALGGLNASVVNVYPDINKIGDPLPLRFSSDLMGHTDTQIGWELTSLGQTAILQSSSNSTPISAPLFLTSSINKDYQGNISSTPNRLLACWWAGPGSHTYIKTGDKAVIRLGARSLFGINSNKDVYSYNVNIYFPYV